MAFGSQGGNLVPYLPVDVSTIWMEMGTYTSQTGADGVWPYGYAFKIGHYGYNIKGWTEWLCAPPCSDWGVGIKPIDVSIICNNIEPLVL